MAGAGEVVIAAVAMAGVITIGVLRALIVALVLSIIEVVARTARPHDAVLGWVERLGRYGDVELHRTARVDPGVVVYRLDDRLFFANAAYFQSRVGEAIEGAATPTRFVVFDAEAMNGIDASGAEAVEQLVRRLRSERIGFVVARMRSAVDDQFRETGLSDLIGEENFHPNVQAAVEACLDVEAGDG
jgi:SulP family sulfate permease